jgi:adenine-specific DNA-methyltransferase
MAKIEDLIQQIPDERLRKGIAAEVKALKKTKKFGLVFEEHLPETVRLPHLPVKPGELVAVKSESGNRLWRVKTIEKKIAVCDAAVEGYPSHKETNKEFPVSGLVVVRSFGEPIYPALVPVDRVERGGPDKPWHLLINADNFHALQLLLYCYEGQVDVIYIDPPYNTGARDWKYNNDYVDATDAWRHSKWLSMMKKRLSLAKRLLKSNGVLIVAIDKNELHHLLMLLETDFPEYEFTNVSVVHNPRGNITSNFALTNENLLFIIPRGLSVIARTRRPNKQPRKLRRWGHNSLRTVRKTMFYPIYVTGETIVRIGKQPDDNFHPSGKNVAMPNGEIEVWPIDQNGVERRWNFGLDSIEEHLDRIVAIKDEDGTTDLFLDEESTVPKTVWTDTWCEAGKHGASLVKQIVGKEFPFPKSVYAVQKCIELVTHERSNALVLDFFGGSGTTMHATWLANQSDGKNRRCILATNNEVDEKRSKELSKRNFFSGDLEFEKTGVCESVTWPRCKYVINGKRDDGTELSGTYLNDREMSEGFHENMEYFRLDFLDPDSVARGDAFAAILPILWMMAGCHGKREDSKGSQDWFIPKHAPFAVLIKEKEFRAFRKTLAERKDIGWIFLVTDSEENFGLMRRALGRKFQCVQLYKSYLENFRINTPEALGQGGAA